MVDCTTENLSSDEVVNESLNQSDQFHYDWTIKEFGEPHHDRLNDLYLVTVKTRHKGFNEKSKEEILEESKERAIDHLVSHFNKVPSNSSKRELIAASEASEWYLDVRPGSRIKALVEVPAGLFQESFVDGVPFPTLELPPPPEPAVITTEDLATLLPDRESAKTIAEKLAEDELLTSDLKYELRKNAEKRVDFVGDQVLASIDQILPRASDLSGIFEEILHRISPDSLLQTLLDCLAEGLPDLEVGGILGIPPIEIPEIELFLLPTTDFLDYIRDLIEEVLEKVLFETLRLFVDMVINLTIKLCEDALDALASFGSDYPEAEEEVETQIINEFPDIPSDAIETLLKEINERLTPEEYCSLLLGRPSESVKKTIEEIFEDYPAIGERFDYDVDKVISFYAAAGDVLGGADILARCQGQDLPFDPCYTSESLRNLQTEIYRPKVDAGLLSEADVAELLEKQAVNNNRIYESIQNFAQKGTLIPNLGNTLNEKIRNLQFQNPRSEPDVFDLTVDSLYGAFEGTLDKELKNYFSSVIKRIREIDDASGLNEILNYKKDFVIPNTQEMARISRKYDLMDYDPSKHSDMLTKLFSNKLFLQDKPFGNLPSNFTKLRSSFIDVEEVKNDTTKEYKAAPLSQRSVCSAGDAPNLFERSILKGAKKVFIRLIVLDFLSTAFISSSTYDLMQLIGNEKFLSAVQTRVKEEMSRQDPYLYSALDISERDIRDNAMFAIDRFSEVYTNALTEGDTRTSLTPFGEAKDEEILLLLSIYSGSTFDKRFNNEKETFVGTYPVDRFKDSKEGIARVMHSLLKLKNTFGNE